MREYHMVRGDLPDHPLRPWFCGDDDCKAMTTVALPPGNLYTFNRHTCFAYKATPTSI
ncbi:MAG: hypothetical protein IPI39_26005 [Candidatus Obscuribacter sp.]|nr:hypothetical protein [Candidatus Obscuribacter sp.]